MNSEKKISEVLIQAKSLKIPKIWENFVYKLEKEFL